MSSFQCHSFLLYVVIIVKESQLQTDRLCGANYEDRRCSCMGPLTKVSATCALGPTTPCTTSHQAPQHHSQLQLPSPIPDHQHTVDITLGWVSTRHPIQRACDPEISSRIVARIATDFFDSPTQQYRFRDLKLLAVVAPPPQIAT
jgi:hypothetical protein